MRQSETAKDFITSLAFTIRWQHRTGYTMNFSRQRNKNGSFIAEAPVALWVLFFFLTIPFIDMSTIMLRYTFFVMAARDGVHEAARAKTFSTNASSSQLSARNTATSQVNATARNFSEIAISNVTTRILETDITRRTITIHVNRLNVPADTSAYLYELETIVTGSINPLLTFNPGFLPRIPGITTAVPVVVSAREYCEYPQGLNI